MARRLMRTYTALATSMKQIEERNQKLEQPKADPKTQSIEEQIEQILRDNTFHGLELSFNPKKHTLSTPSRWDLGYIPIRGQNSDKPEDSMELLAHELARLCIVPVPPSPLYDAVVRHMEETKQRILNHENEMLAREAAHREKLDQLQQDLDELTITFKDQPVKLVVSGHDERNQCTVIHESCDSPDTVVYDRKVYPDTAGGGMTEVRREVCLFLINHGYSVS